MKNHYTIHGANEGKWGVRILKKPMAGTKRDHILFYWKSSRGSDRADFVAMTDFEALTLANMLIWALIKRNKRCKLEEME